MIGTPSVPTDELALTVVAAAFGALLGHGRGTRSGGGLLAGAALVSAAVAGVAAMALLPADQAAGPVGGALVLALVLGAVAAATAALLQGGHATSRLAWLLVGAAAGFAIDANGWLGDARFGALAAAAMAFAAAGALLPTARVRGGREPDGVPGLVGAAAPAATAALLWSQRPVVGDFVELPAAAALAAGFGAFAAAALPARWHARAAAAGAAALALAIGDGVRFAAFGWDAALLAAPAGTLLGLALAASPGGALAPAAVVLVAAALAHAGLRLEVSSGVLAALAVALGLLPALRRSATVPVALLVALAAVGVRIGWPAAPRAPDGHVVLARASGEQALYRAADQAMVLARGPLAVDAAGPERPHAALLAGLVQLFARASAPGPVVVVDSGTGRIAAAMAGLALVPALWVEPEPAAPALRAALARVGPTGAADPRPPSAPGGTAAPIWSFGTREFAWRVPPGSCGAIVAAAPLLAPTSSRAAIEEHRAWRRAAGAGLVLQAAVLDATPRSVLQSALAAAAAVHPWSGVFLFGRTVVVCGHGRSIDPTAAAAGLAGLSDAVRVELHAAGLGVAADLPAAFLGRLIPRAASPTVAGDDARVRAVGPPPGPELAAANAEVLAGALVDGAGRSLASARLLAWSTRAADLAAADEQLRAALRAAPPGVLLAREQLAVARRLAERAIAATDPRDPGAVAAAAELAARFCHLGSPSPALQAALALPDRRGQRVREPFAAAQAALALDPTFAATAPPVLRPLVASLPARSPLADLGAMPGPARLAELVVGDGALAIALRTRFAAHGAAALVEAWRRGPLAPAALTALRELADPFVLDAAAGALAAPGGGPERGAELLRIWRRDLPASAPIRALATGDASAREALQVAIAGRTDPGSLELLARGLVDPELAVRTAAGAALFRSIGDRIAYDPEWPAERLDAAAAQLAALIPRTP
ncbi:MAG: hypothetical protein AB7O84_06030 [Planctomycetota bacterium]